MHGEGEGHRCAHCIFDGSPYRRTGYTLRLAGVFTAEDRREAARLERKAWQRMCREARP